MQHGVIDTSFRLHGEFYAKKCSKVFLWNIWNLLTRIHRRKMKQETKNDAFCTPGSRDDQIATSAKLLDITHESYRFSADLVETILINVNVVRPVLVGVIIRLVHTMKVMCIGSKLIRIVCVHTECALTAIRSECAFS